MEGLYKDLFLNFYFIILLSFVLSLLLVLLNKCVFKFLTVPFTNQARTKNRGFETYEFGTHSVGSVSTISSNQVFILAIIFLLFDIELVFLISWVVNLNITWNLGNFLILFFCNLIVYSFLLELYSGILVWYKNKKIKLL